MKHFGTKVIRTGQLMLRELDIEDAPALYRNWGQYAASTAGLRLEPFTARRQMRDYIDRAAKRYKNPNFYCWVITIAESEDPVGIAGMNIVSASDEVGSLFVSIGEPFADKGYAAEALRAIIDYAFRDIGFNRIEAHSTPGIGISAELMKQCGLNCEGRARQRYKTGTGFEDCDVYAILRGEYGAK